MSNSLWRHGLQHTRLPSSFTISWSLLKLMSIESVMPSNHLIFCCLFSFCPPSFAASGSFPMSQLFAAHGLQHTRLACPLLSLRVCSNSYSLSRWCHPSISSSVTSFSSCLQSFLASGSFPISWLFTSSGQNIGASASASDLPVNIQGWLPLGLISLISLLSKELSTVFSSTTVQKHQLFSVQPSLWTNSHMHTWLLEKP